MGADDRSIGRIRFPLVTERLTIRPMRLDDAESLHEMYSDPMAMQHLASDLPKTVEESARWVQDKIDLHESTGLSLWAVERTDTGEVIGDVGLQVEGDDGSVGVGVRIVRPLWRRGYGSEAAQAAIDAGVRDLGLERIIAMTGPENVKAIAAMERGGMRYTGTESHFGRDWVVYDVKDPTTDA